MRVDELVDLGGELGEGVTFSSRLILLLWLEGEKETRVKEAQRTG